VGTGADRGGIEGRLIERARDESRGWTNADYDLVLSAADAIGEARRALRALLVIAGAQDKLLVAYRIGRRPGDKALDAMKGRDSALADAATALARLEGGDRGNEQIGMDEG
jgi:hypothetical protein